MSPSHTTKDKDKEEEVALKRHHAAISLWEITDQEILALYSSFAQLNHSHMVMQHSLKSQYTDCYLDFPVLFLMQC